jgi:methyltransferase
MAFIIFISIFILQRLSELVVARRNEKWLRANGAIEYGQRQYPPIVLLHSFFILSMIGEYYVRNGRQADYLFAGVFLILLSIKVWVIASLGKYWNTKILRIPGMVPIKKGPYKYFTHPNYIIVICEFIVVPLVFHLWYTAIIFSLLNAVILTWRIRTEDQVWSE